MSILNALNTFTAFNKRILIFILGAMLFLGSVNLSYGNDIPEDYPYAEFYSHSQGQDRGWFGAFIGGISGAVHGTFKQWSKIGTKEWSWSKLGNDITDWANTFSAGEDIISSWFK